MIPIKISTQPDETTCGPTSLHAIYNYFGDTITLNEVVSQVPSLDTGGTLAVMLACHALKRGYHALIYTYNLLVFDPTWFSNKHTDLKKKLIEQEKYKHGVKFHRATQAYLEFLDLGGKFYFKDLNPRILKKYFDQSLPILTGLSATYLYKSSREYTDRRGRTIHNDIRGLPSGHFVVLSGYDKKKNIIVADPYGESESGDNYYSVKVGRLLNSILLGVLTYDANFVIIQPRNI
jgi:hypothetical protein